MTDAHCHVSCGDPRVRELVIGRDFVGVHPWQAEGADVDSALTMMRNAVVSANAVGIGEIGLDRLRSRTISPIMREVYERQLSLAAELGCPAVLHGAKCWGEVVDGVRRLPKRPPSFLCHGFSRSTGLLPLIAELGGFVSVGPAVLNDHAVNYRALVRMIPDDMLLVETDRTSDRAEASASVVEVLAKTAELRGQSPDAIEALTDANADRFLQRN